MRAAAVTGLVLTSTAAAIVGQSQKDPAQLPRFVSSIDVVTLDVTVLDRNRRPVRGLTAADFTVLENDTAQTIVAFDEVTVAGAGEPRAAWVRDVAPDVKTNDLAPQGRILVIVLDDATLPPAPEFVINAKQAARRVVDTMGPSDLAAVVFTLNNRHAQDFTNDRAKLLAAIDKLTFGFALDVIKRDPYVIMRDPMVEYNFSVKTVKAAIEALGAIPQRRKAVVYVSVGLQVSALGPSAAQGQLGGGGGEGERIARGYNLVPQRIAFDPGLSAAMLQLMREAFTSAARSNVNVYAVNPGGLGGLDSFIATRQLPLDPGLFREYLQIWAENTGGVALVNTNDPAAEVGQILDETGSYYLLAYRTDGRRDGGFRRTRVRVNRPDVTVRTRNGYFAERPKPPPATNPEDLAPAVLLTAMSGFLPKGDVAMEVTAAPFAIPGKKEAALAIVARVRQAAVATRTVQNVELLTKAFDPQGKPRGAQTQNARVVLLPAESANADFEVLSRIDLRPGRYQLRIAAHNAGLAKSGSVYYDIDVPDFAKPGLWLSGAVLSAMPAIPVAPRDVLSSLLPVVPTAVREFANDDVATAFLRVYQQPRDAREVAITARVIDQDGNTMAQVEDRIRPGQFEAAGAADYRYKLPLDRLHAGPHLLAIDARAGDHAARREVRFSRK